MNVDISTTIYLPEAGDADAEDSDEADLTNFDAYEHADMSNVVR